MTFCCVTSLVIDALSAVDDYLSTASSPASFMMVLYVDGLKVKTTQKHAVLSSVLRSEV
jgi:hypothetical protein